MSSLDPSEPYIGALLGLACGDALGAPVEFHSQSEVETRHGRLTEMVGGGSWAPGEWTDDTGMALCVAEGILANPDDPISEVGRRFLEWQEDAKDIGNTITAALRSAASQVGQIDWAAASRSTPQAKNHKAGGNGSLMRTLPVALAYPGMDKMLDVSARISAMTHWDPQAEICCAIYCLWVREILYGAQPRQGWETALELGREVADRDRRSSDTPGPVPLPDTVWSRLENAPDLELTDLQPTGYAGYVVDCLEAAVWATVQTPSLEDALVTLVNLGGESDTMAAVAGGAVGARFGRSAIPERWLSYLFERQRVESVARDLFDLRHAQVYLQPNLPQFAFRHLEGGLFYGRNPLTARDVRTLIEAGVTEVLDLREEREWTTSTKWGREAVAALERSSVERHTVPVVDGHAPGLEQLDQTSQILSEGLEHGSVYVHCRAGIERTGAVIAAYLARRDRRSVDDVLLSLNQANAGLYPLRHQIEAVRRWLDRDKE